jgi:hypothetical protein
MVAKIIDSIVYFVGVSSIGIMTLLWDKNIYLYNSANKNVRKIYRMKYGLIPQEPIYQELNNKKLIWENIKNENSKELEINSIFNIDDIRINVNINDGKNDSNNISLLNKVINN